LIPDTNTGVVMGSTGGMYPLEAYSDTQNSVKNAPKHFIFTPKSGKFLRRGPLVRNGHPYPNTVPHPSSAPTSSY